MAYCQACGSAAGGRFCPSCGKEVTSTRVSAVIPMNAASALCYLIPVIVPAVCLLVEPYKADRKVRFDAIQSLLLTLCLFVADEIIGFLDAGSLQLSLVLYRVLRLATLVLLIYLAFRAFQNQKVVLPGIGPFAEKQLR